ncbi:hypothetical protein MXB_246, partial [Myxobolus squamalis]
TFLNKIVVILTYKLTLKIVLVDFENALLNSVKFEFPKVRVIAYYFYFRQALFRKRKKIGISGNSVNKCLTMMKQFSWTSNQLIQARIIELKYDKNLIM